MQTRSSLTEAGASSRRMLQSCRRINIRSAIRVATSQVQHSTMSQALSGPPEVTQFIDTLNKQYEKVTTR
jgi:hypothetical protein